MTPSQSPRCLRHHKVMAACTDCTAALRARRFEAGATTTDTRAFPLAA